MTPLSELINVYGADLSGGRGFESFRAAKATWDDKPPYESLWKVDGEIYRVVKMLGRPVFDFYQE
jgi:hypothetical protein